MGKGSKKNKKTHVTSEVLSMIETTLHELSKGMVSSTNIAEISAAGDVLLAAKSLALAGRKLKRMVPVDKSKDDKNKSSTDAVHLVNPQLYDAPEKTSACHPSHHTRISLDASSYDEICIHCGSTDNIGGWGKLSKRCPKAVRDEQPVHVD